MSIVRFSNTSGQECRYSTVGSTEIRCWQKAVDTQVLDAGLLGKNDSDKTSVENPARGKKQEANFKPCVPNTDISIEEQCLKIWFRAFVLGNFLLGLVKNRFLINFL
ncbi:MAG: hypothetical protein LBD29_04195 [Treponema sp.]|jgi:hypothetical protein|nr:hypothetical protein [Treponema sp.]